MAPEPGGQARHRDAGDAALPAAQGIRRAGQDRFAGRLRDSCGTRPPPTSRPSGAAWPASCTGSSRSTRCSSGTSPFAKWFVGGKTNVSYNCLDRTSRHAGASNKAALIWEGEPGDTRTLTYAATAPRGLQVRQRAQEAGHRAGRRRLDLHADGARAGDRHAGLRRIGAVHSVIFAGFSAEAIADRNNDAKAKLQITADCRLAARPAAAAQGERRRGAAKSRPPSSSASCSSGPATRCTCSRAATTGGTS